MKKYRYLLFIIFLCFSGYYAYQKYVQHQNWHQFFRNPDASLFTRTDSIFSYHFFKKLSIPTATMDSVRHHICTLKDDILIQNKKHNVFSHNLLKNELDKKCSDLALYGPSEHPFYLKNTYLCNTQKECQTILLQLDDYLILDTHQVWHIQDNHLIPNDYDLFFKNVLKIDHPDKVVFLGFNPTGIGNNLFQYWGAFVYAQKQNKTLIPIQHRPILDIFKNMAQPTEALSAFQKTYYFFNVQERKIDFNTPRLLFNQNPIAYQNLAGYDDYIRAHTQFAEPLSPFNQTIADKMQSENSIAVHIRRGDFESAGIDMLKMSYYDNAFNYINDKLETPHFYIFSDDINWSKQNLTIPFPHTFVDWNKKDYEDLHLMTYCNHFIIANSSFSWWGAFLSKHKNKIVVIPKTGFYRSENTLYNEDFMSFPGCISIDE